MQTWIHTRHMPTPTIKTYANIHIPTIFFQKVEKAKEKAKEEKKEAKEKAQKEDRDEKMAKWYNNSPITHNKEPLTNHALVCENTIGMSAPTRACFTLRE